MDVGGPAHYVAKAMEWLLILSAMLSAVTGAFSGGQGEEVRLQRTEAATALRAAAVVEQAAEPAATAIPADLAGASTEVRALVDFALPAAIPLYAERRIE